jgi:hypothetical protein
MENASQWQNRIVRYGVQPADQFTANPRNPRKHPQKQRDAVEGSLNTLGWIAPVVVNVRTGYMIDGHERVWQALARDNAPVPFVEVDLSEDEEALALATFDFITYMAEYDRDNLDALLREVNTDDAALQAAIAELSESVGLYTDETPKDAPAAQVDQAEELQEKWKTERGQLWLIPSLHGGEHRLLCGDSTNADDVNRLGLRDEYVFFCDPFFQDALIAKVRAIFDTRAAVYITGGHQIKDVVCGLPSFHEGVLLGLSSIPQMGNKHKLFYEHKVVYWVADYPLNFGIGFSSVIYNVEGATRKYGDVYHHTSKPIDMVEKLIKPFRETVVVDPFSGSGTTFVVCERLRSQCCGLEIEPGYVAAILERLSLMGLSPHLA